LKERSKLGFFKRLGLKAGIGEAIDLGETEAELMEGESDSGVLVLASEAALLLRSVGWRSSVSDCGVGL
jgi:hypothetical protein